MTVAKKKKPHDGPKCGAKKRGGGTCTQVAGWGTDHPGQGRCKLHGGKTPIKSGRYSDIKRPRLNELIAKFAADPDPLNLLPEALLLRALATDYVERYDELTAALIKWHESFIHPSKEAFTKPTTVPDVADVARLIDRVGAMIDRIVKHKKEGSITLETMDRVVEQLGIEMVKAAQEVITDEAQRTKLLQAVEKRWGSVRLDTGRVSDQGAAQG